MSPKIILFCDEIQSGKTNILTKLFSHREDVAGFLCPDFNGKRHFYNLETKTLKPFQADIIEEKLSTIDVGRFKFYTSIFDEAKFILRNEGFAKLNFFIIDEIGKLELADSGLSPDLGFFLFSFTKTIDTKPYLILVVRKSLLDQVILKFGLENIVILDLSTIERYLVENCNFNN